jgi:hypothetical protein
MSEETIDGLKVYIQSISAVKPGILRVNVITYFGDKNATYEMAVVDKDFVTYNEDGSQAEIDIAAFTQLITQQIDKLRNTANLAMALEAADLSWTIRASNSNTLLVEDDDIPDQTREGMQLAYGDQVDDSHNEV